MPREASSVDDWPIQSGEGESDEPLDAHPIKLDDYHRAPHRGPIDAPILIGRGVQSLRRAGPIDGSALSALKRASLQTTFGYTQLIDCDQFGLAVDS